MPIYQEKNVTMSVIQGCNGEYLQRLIKKLSFIFYLSAPVVVYIIANKTVQKEQSSEGKLFKTEKELQMKKIKLKKTH